MQRNLLVDSEIFRYSLNVRKDMLPGKDISAHTVFALDPPHVVDEGQNKAITARGKLPLLMKPV